MNYSFEFLMRYDEIKKINQPIYIKKGRFLFEKKVCTATGESLW